MLNLNALILSVVKPSVVTFRYHLLVRRHVHVSVIHSHSGAATSVSLSHRPFRASTLTALTQLNWLEKLVDCRRYSSLLFSSFPQHRTASFRETPHAFINDEANPSTWSEFPSFPQLGFLTPFLRHPRQTPLDGDDAHCEASGLFHLLPNSEHKCRVRHQQSLSILESTALTSRRAAGADRASSPSQDTTNSVAAVAAFDSIE